MEIWLLSGEYPPLVGGVGDYTRRLAAALAAQGPSLRVLTRSLPSPPPQDSGVAVDAVLTTFGLGLLGQLGRRLSRRSPDILHIQYQAAAYDLRGGVHLLPLLARLRARRTLCAVTFHDLNLPYLFRGGRPLRRLSLRLLAATSRLVVTTNQGDRGVLAGWVGSGRLRTIPIGANVLPEPLSGWDESDWRRRQGIPAGLPMVVFFGLLNRTKGVEDLLEAVHRLRSRGCELQLVLMGDLVGSSDPTNLRVAEQVKARVGELGLEERVRFTGFLGPRALSEHFAAASLCVLPYRDGASLRRGTLMAALAHGTPTISTHPQAEDDGLRSGDALLLVPPADPEALAAAMDRLLRSPRERARLSEGGRRLAREHGWTGLARQHLEAYGELLRG